MKKFDFGLRETGLTITRRVCSVDARVCGSPLRTLCACCLVLLVWSVGAPLHFDNPSHHPEREPAIVVLDVCHAGHSAISGNTEMPSVCGAVSAPPVPGFCGHFMAPDCRFSPLIIGLLKDRPPRFS
jgi:hypothetical protein